ncbi:MAG: flagellar export protein FliJ [Lachnospiraceae bacterium]|nr:flagellar export protein FliJ [Lachnospiraceae bacterium]
MAKFVYRMQNILNLKEKLEEQARNEYAEQRMHLNEAEEEEERLKDEKRLYEEEAVRLRSKSLNILDIEANANAIYALDSLIEDQRQVVKREEALLEKKREKLEEAMKDRKTQDKLKEHAFEDFKADLLYQESKEIDQLTSYTYGVKQLK